MRTTLHLVLCVLAALPLLVANMALTLALWLYVLAAKVLPDATRGNCWSFVAPKVWHEGGHLVIRPAVGVRLLWVGMVQHVGWAKRLHGDIEQTEPVQRYQGPALLWRWVYFRFAVRGQDSRPTGPWSRSQHGDLGR